MEKLYIKTVPIQNASREVKDILENRYRLTNSNLRKSLEGLQDYLSTLRSDLHVTVEHPYVDKTYRDTYYNYFASKNDDYPRNAIRLSFFSYNIPDEDFRETDKLSKIEEYYLGFLVLRPTFPFIIGRSLIRPEAFMGGEALLTCTVNYNTTANGIKLQVKGFPHSSQDSEMITCAETTVWSIIEYFGNKYAEYSPILPSKVTSILGRFAFERLIPSKGLTAAQISYALRELGFGVKIYSRKSNQKEFYQLLRTYVESGIPVVGLIQNSQGIGHTINIVGRKKITDSQINALPVCANFGNNVTLYDFADIDTEYVMIDDNYPPYRPSFLSDPASYYTNPKWKGCEVTNFIVPLYPKIYLEAGEARKIALALIKNLNLISNKSIIIKTF